MEVCVSGEGGGVCELFHWGGAAGAAVDVSSGT